MGTAGGQKEILAHVRGQGSGSGSSTHSPEEAAERFIELLHMEMLSSDLTAHAREAIYDLAYTPPQELPDGSYKFRVYFTGDMHRNSLDPDQFKDGISNIAELLNNGTSMSGTVHGVWHWLCCEW